MSEYQRYEFMTVDKPLTREEINEVNDLSSHIEVSATHAVVEYHWGDFKHNPIKILREYFDGFLYWANWGSPQLAFRFPHGTLPARLLNDYDFEDFVELIQYEDYDILNIEFSDMEGLDGWVSYELGSLLPIRQELIEGDLRSLYIVWLAARYMIEGYDDEEEDYDDGEEDYDVIAPPVPPGLKQLTSAQRALIELLPVPSELLVVAAQHSTPATTASDDDFAAWIKLLPEQRRNDYLLRLARNEAGLSNLLVRELRELGGTNKTTAPEGERITYAKLLAESRDIEERREREQREQEQLARQRYLQNIHEQPNTYWDKVEQAVKRTTASGYDEALGLLVDLRDAAEYFQESQQFQTRFQSWVQPHVRRQSLIKRLIDNDFKISRV
jgi:hypothetical protein